MRLSNENCQAKTMLGSRMVVCRVKCGGNRADGKAHLPSRGVDTAPPPKMCHRVGIRGPASTGVVRSPPYNKHSQLFELATAALPPLWGTRSRMCIHRSLLPSYICNIYIYTYTYNYVNICAYINV